MHILPTIALTTGITINETGNAIAKLNAYLGSQMERKPFVRPLFMMVRHSDMESDMNRDMKKQKSAVLYLECNFMNQIHK